MVVEIIFPQHMRKGFIPTDCEFRRPSYEKKRAIKKIWIPLDD